MIFAWVNFAVLVAATILMLYFYVRSVSPAGRERVIGPRAFTRCLYDRIVATGFEAVIIADFVLYRFHPLATPLPQRFPWPWWISLLVALLIGIPASLLMIVGLRDAGEEAMRPRKEHTMYGGIYTRIRHPQAVGEVFLFPIFGLLVNSPALTLFSLVYFPIFALMCRAEEQDLLLRFGEAYAGYCRRTGAFLPRRRDGSGTSTVREPPT